MSELFVGVLNFSHLFLFPLFVPKFNPHYGPLPSASGSASGKKDGHETNKSNTTTNYSNKDEKVTGILPRQNLAVSNLLSKNHVLFASLFLTVQHRTTQKMNI